MKEAAVKGGMPCPAFQRVRPAPQRALPHRTLAPARFKPLPLPAAPLSFVPLPCQIKSPMNLLGFAKHHGLPLVVKPVFGSASLGVSIVPDQEGLTDFLRNKLLKVGRGGGRRESGAKWGD